MQGNWWPVLVEGQYGKGVATEVGPDLIDEESLQNRAVLEGRTNFISIGTDAK